MDTLQAMKGYAHQTNCEAIVHFNLQDHQRDLDNFADKCLEFGYCCQRREPEDKMRKEYTKLIDQLLSIGKNDDVLISNLNSYMQAIVGEGKNYAMLTK